MVFVPLVFVVNLVHLDAAFIHCVVLCLANDNLDHSRSRLNTVTKLAENRYLSVVAFFAWHLRLHTRYVYPVYKAGQIHRYDGKGFVNVGRDIFQNRCNYIQSLVSQDRLLELRLGDGWDPLCKFLNVPNPGVEYPRVNDEASANKRFEAIIRYTMWLVVKRLVTLTLAAGATAFTLHKLVTQFPGMKWPFLTYRSS